MYHDGKLIDSGSILPCCYCDVLLASKRQLTPLLSTNRSSEMMMKQAVILLLARSWSFTSTPLLPLSSAFVGVQRRQRPPQLWRSFHSSSFGSTSSFASPTRPSLLLAKPKKAGSVVDNYQTVSVNCSKCQQRLFRYKKKNGTKSNLVKCYVERISEDSAGVLALAASRENSSAPEPKSDTTPSRKSKNKTNRKQKQKQDSDSTHDDNTTAAEDTSPFLVPTQLDPGYSWECPSCHTQFARSSVIHGRPALKLVGGKIRMTKK